MLAEILIVLDDVAIAEGGSEPLVLPDKVADGVGTALSVEEGLKLPVEVADGVGTAVADGDDVLLGVFEGVDSGVGKSVSLPEGVGVVEGTELGVILALPPNEIVDGGVSDDEGVILCVESGVGVIVNVFELLVVAETLKLVVGVTVLEPVDESEPVPALDEEAEGTVLDVILALSPKEIVESGVVDDEVVGIGLGVIDNVFEMDRPVIITLSTLNVLPYVSGSTDMRQQKVGEAEAFIGSILVEKDVIHAVPMKVLFGIGFM